MTVASTAGGFGMAKLASGHSVATIAADRYYTNQGRTPGAVIGALVPDLQPPLDHDFQIVAWSIQATLLLETNLNSTPTRGPHGLLGDILAGLVIGDPPPPVAFANHPPPTDNTLIEKLFAGDSDQSPPWAPSPAVSVTARQQLPQPLPLDYALGVSLGLWMTPGISPTSSQSTADFFFSLVSASWAVYYDNGKD